MTDLFEQVQLETEARALALGALPHAPLAMPVQQLETPQRAGLLNLLLLSLRPARATKVGP